MSSDPEVQGVVRVSQNGERVYFVARGELAGENGEKQKPQQGADNLYVYDTLEHSTTFVTTLLTAAEESSLEAAEAAEKSQIEAQALAEREAQDALLIGELERGEISSERAELLREEAEVEEAAFIQTTLGTRGPSGTLAEDRSVWRAEDSRPAQATPEGRFLVFPSSADLTSGDESKVPQLFEYDASNEKLTRVSIGQGGSYSNDGNVATFHDAPQIPAELSFSGGIDLPTTAESALAVSSDGKRVVFTSAARLVPQVEDRGAPNVYQYQEEDVYLLSDGRDDSMVGNEPTVKLFGTTASGQDVFFSTADQLVPQGVVAQDALYDAREEGGFPAPIVTPGCVGETCRGTTEATPQLQLPATLDQVGGDNLPPPVESKPVSKRKPLTRAQKLAKALKACRAKRNKRKLARCEAQARKQYGTKSKSKAAKSNRGHRKAGRQR